MPVEFLTSNAEKVELVKRSRRRTKHQRFTKSFKRTLKKRGADQIRL